jgi:subtilisin family serine protease
VRSRSQRAPWFAAVVIGVVVSLIGTILVRSAAPANADVVPRISIGDASIVEGNTGAPRTLKFSVTLSQPATTAVTVQYALRLCSGDGCASSSDVSLKPGTLHFTPSRTTGLTGVQKFIVAKITPDTAFEGDRHFSVVLTSASGATLFGGPALGTIFEDDTAGQSGASAGVGDATVWEGDVKDRTASVPVTLSSPATITTKVVVTLTAGDATPGLDYKPWSTKKTLTFLRGQSAVFANVVVHPDAIPEAVEHASVTLSPPTGMTAFRATGQVTINDDDSVANSPTVALAVDGTVQPSVAQIPSPDGEAPSPVAAGEDQHGTKTDFVEGEVLVQTNDAAQLSAFLTQWNGTIVFTIDPAPTIVKAIAASGGAPPVKTYLVRVDPALADVSSLQATLVNYLENAPYSATNDLPSNIDLRFSSLRAEQTYAITVAGVTHGLTVGVDPVAYDTQFEGGHSSEGATGDASIPGVAYSPDAFEWPYMNHEALDANGHRLQDVGVGEAWRQMENAGDLTPTRGPRVLVIDGGFQPNNDFPPYTSIGPNFGAPNPGNCEGQPCPWHGTHVVEVGFGTANNGFGVAGPGGPVAKLMLSQAPSPDVGDELRYAEDTVPRLAAANPQIVNISGSRDIVAGLCLIGTCALVDAVASDLRNGGVLVIAAAGNQAENVDATDCADFPWHHCWERSETIPCESDDVLCVGGMMPEQPGLDDGSNYGTDTSSGDSVDLYAPFDLWSNADPNPPNPLPAGATDFAGTSGSSPFVAGVASLVWAVNPNLNPTQVYRILLRNAHRVPNSTLLPQVKGWVNALGAVQATFSRGTPPFLQILSPSQGQVYPGGTRDPVPALRCVQDDLEDGTLPDSSITWTSNIDGFLGHGCNLVAFLDQGTHVLTVTATDSDGNTTTRQVTVTVSNPLVSVDITAPPTGSVFEIGQPMYFAGDSWDPASSAQLPSSSLGWSCTNESTGLPCAGTGTGGRFGTGPSASLNPSTIGVGHYRITLANLDGRGGTDSRDVVVEPAGLNVPPSVAITSPAEGVHLLADQFISPDWYAHVTFTSVSSDDNPPLEDIHWTVRRQTSLGSVVVFDEHNTGLTRTFPLWVDPNDTAACLPTRYSVTLQVTDRGGLTNAFTRDIGVYVLC